MRRFLRVLAGVALLLAVGAVLVACVLYAAAPDVPHLAGSITSGSLMAGGRERTYFVYLPHDLPRQAPLVMVLHGSDGNADRVRKATGYGFERLADQHRFAVVYPEAYEGNWNACNIKGDYSANVLGIDDVGFLMALVDRLIKEYGIDAHRVFAAGVSRGGSMTYRLALEAPSRFRAVAAVAANVPAPQKFQVQASARRHIRDDHEWYPGSTKSVRRR